MKKVSSSRTQIELTKAAMRYGKETELKLNHTRVVHKVSAIESCKWNYGDRGNFLAALCWKAQCRHLLCTVTLGRVATHPKIKMAAASFALSWRSWIYRKGLVCWWQNMFLIHDNPHLQTAVKLSIFVKICQLLTTLRSLFSIINIQSLFYVQ